MADQSTAQNSIRRATAEDAPVLEALQRRSTEHWGYPPEYFDWDPGAMDIPADYIDQNPVYLLARGDRIIGFYGLTKDEGVLWLDKLFVDRDAIGQGYGRLLWRHAAERTRTLGYPSLDIGADPNSAPFYAAMGATWLGSRTTANPAWTIQLYRYAVPDLMIRPAVPAEAPLLHELTGRSVLSWGYEPEFLDWEPEAIAVTPDLLEQSHAWALEIGGTVVGYYALMPKPAGLYLDKVFIEPGWIGVGLGKRLWQHAVDQARRLGADRILVEADPNAGPFYTAMGATWTGEIDTTWPGWKLQCFEFPLGMG